MTEPRRALSEVMGQDHRDLDELWERVAATPATDRPVRERLFVAFRSGLLAHIAEEEERLFPLFDATDPGLRGLVARLLEEHREIRGLLDRIDRELTTGTGNLEELGFELVNVLGEHNAREESVAYPWLDGHLPHDRVLEVERRLGSRGRS